MDPSSRSERSLSIPPLTAVVCSACIVVWIAIWLQAGDSSWETAARHGILGVLNPDPQKTWGGAYWGLLTSTIVHVEVWHLIFNLYWFWILGGILERAIGPARWLAFFVS